MKATKICSMRRDVLTVNITTADRSFTSLPIQRTLEGSSVQSLQYSKILEGCFSTPSTPVYPPLGIRYIAFLKFGENVNIRQSFFIRRFYKTYKKKQIIRELLYHCTNIQYAYNKFPIDT